MFDLSVAFRFVTFWFMLDLNVAFRFVIFWFMLDLNVAFRFVIFWFMFDLIVAFRFVIFWFMLDLNVAFRFVTFWFMFLLLRRIAFSVVFTTISFVLTTLLELTGTDGAFFVFFVFERDRNCTGSATFSRLRRFLIALTTSVFFAPSTMTAFTFLATDFSSLMVDDFLKSTL
jgi:hypothetical protein